MMFRTAKFVLFIEISSFRDVLNKGLHYIVHVHVRMYYAQTLELHVF